MPPGPLPNGPPQPPILFCPSCWNAFIGRTLASRHPNVKLGLLSVSGGDEMLQSINWLLQDPIAVYVTLVLPFQSYNTTER
jgi:hypothetical protein